MCLVGGVSLRNRFPFLFPSGVCVFFFGGEGVEKVSVFPFPHRFFPARALEMHQCGVFGFPGQKRPSQWGAKGLRFAPKAVVSVGLGFHLLI